MDTQIKILIVEDEMIIAANISLDLTNLGYEVTGILPRGEEAVVHLKENKPDIVLLDIQLKGKLDGVETARLLKEEYDVPIIYLTANADELNFARAKETKPHAFISKPFKKLDLQRAIELAAERIRIEDEKVFETLPEIEKEGAIWQSDSIFIKQQEKMVKVPLDEIYYVSADRNYSHIHTSDKEHLVVMTLKELDQKLPSKSFCRIHRSYLVNTQHITELSPNHIMVANKLLPLSKSFREELLKKLNTL